MTTEAPKTQTFRPVMVVLSEEGANVLEALTQEKIAEHGGTAAFKSLEVLLVENGWTYSMFVGGSLLTQSLAMAAMGQTPS